MLVRPLTPELRKIAEVELNETPKRLYDGINHLKQWIIMQPHLRARTDDQWLAAFLRGCKHSMERAKTKLDLYYTLRTIAPDLFSLKQNDEKFKDMVKTGSVLVLPNTTKSSDPRVVLIRAANYDPNKYTLLEFISFSLICQQILYLDDDVFMVNGTINIIDLEGITMTHVVQMTPTAMKKLSLECQEAAPLRLKRIYFINSPPMFEKFFLTIAIQFLNNKHKDRIYVTSKGISVLHEILGKDIFPVEYGGSAYTEQEIVDKWAEKIDKYREWLNEDEECGTDESKRPGKPNTAEDMFGVAGSFRQLEVD